MRLHDTGTIVQLLRRRAEDQPNRAAFVFLKGGEVESARLTYRELDTRAHAVADHLGQMKMLGERALLLYPSGLEFIEAFFGCLYAGVVAVPCYPPRRNRSDPRVAAIVRDAQATLALTTAEVLRQADLRMARQPEMKAVRWLATDELVTGPVPPTRLPSVDNNALAYLQYTSGSTSTPKGVMVCHGALLNTLADLDAGWKHDSSSVMVTWLPLFHDMGLIYGVLQPLYNGFPCYLMDPASFLQRPVRWLEAISAYRGTHSAAPNFAFDLCRRSITEEQKATLDLSSWQVALNAAEPVREVTLRKFSTAFAPCGFPLRALCPGYGLAESTLKVTAVRRDAETKILRVRADALARGRVQDAAEGEANARTLVGCGQSEVGTRVVIVDPETLTESAPDQVGEIWVSGGSVAQGYWMRPQETEETFAAHLADTSDGPFLRTGDLGFLRHGELFITGRLKDMIIIRGLNHYPQDIELTVERSHEALRAGCGAAFAIEVDGEERLVVAQELKRTGNPRDSDLAAIGAAIRQAVAESHDLQVHAIALLRTGSIAKTSSGKIQRRACRAGFLDGTLKVIWQWRQADAGDAVGSARAAAPPATLATSAPSITAASLRTVLAPWLQAPASRIDIDAPFVRYGIDSITAVRISGELAARLDRPLPPTLLYDHPTVRSLALFLTRPDTQPGPANRVRAHHRDESIAVIGMGCRFPGADSPRAFWKLLSEGTDAVTEVPSSRWDADQFYDPTPGTIGKMVSRWGGFLSQVDQFDADFFGISRGEAELMDPQQRLLLEVAWEALENAGEVHVAGTRTGVFVGISSFDYWRIMFGQPAAVSAYAGTGNALSIAANRLSYSLDLRGPSLAIDTACSSSLVAIHQACESLRHGQCEAAIAGGVNLILAPDLTIAFSQARMLSPTGRCKTFDAEADGYVRGEGCGVIVLKRLADARRDNNRILAIIRGSAVNQDGRSNGLTAPNGRAQQAVIREALACAGVAAGRVSYVEAHGTGTSLGDPIELNSLVGVLGEERSTDQRCWVGSVKTNIGHLEAAAGIAGVIKVVLALQHRQLPAHLHLTTLNPHIALDNPLLSIPRELEDWPDQGDARIAGVSSFGFGGTNAHVVVEEAPPHGEPVSEPDRSCHLLTLSAKSDGALREVCSVWRDHLQTNEEPLPDVCFTANTGRSHFQHRLAVIAGSREELVQRLTAVAQRLPLDDSAMAATTFGETDDQYAKVAFLFTGQGSQYVAMGRELFASQPVFRDALKRCDEILRSQREQSLLSVLYPEQENKSPLDETEWCQPALFALEYALSELWKSWGIIPCAVLGHSVGEYAAACVAGVLELPDALKLVAQRGALMQRLPRDGVMAAIAAGVDRVEPSLQAFQDSVSIAAVNGPGLTVISGAREPMAEVLELLDRDGIPATRLNTSHAFHSPLIEPALDGLAAVAADMAVKPPAIPLIANLTGESADATFASPEYWRRQARHPVQFARGMRKLGELGCRVFVEIGPAPVLLGMGRTCLSAASESTLWLPSLRRGAGDWQEMLQSLSQLYVRGAAVDWTGFDRPFARRRLALPTYPFTRKRYWTAPAPVGNRRPSSGTDFEAGAGHPLLGARRMSPLARDEVEFTCRLSLRRLSYLQDHRVFGTIRLPLSVYLEMALAAGREVFGGQPFAIESVAILQPAILSDQQDMAVSAVLLPRPSGYRLQIFSAAAHGGDAAWTLHLEATLAATAAARPAAATDFLSAVKFMPNPAMEVATAQARARLGLEELSIERYFAACRRRGFDFQPSKSALQKLWRGDAGILAKLGLPESLAAEFGDYHCHPVLLDACLHTAAAALPESNEDGWLAEGVERMELVAPSHLARWVQACLRPTTADPCRSADLRVTADDGTVVAKIDGMRMKRANRLSPVDLPSAAPRNDLYEIAWVRRDRQAPVETVSPKELDCQLVAEPTRWRHRDELIQLGHAGMGGQDDAVIPSDAEESLERRKQTLFAADTLRSPVVQTAVKGRWLILADATDGWRRLAELLRARGQQFELVASPSLGYSAVELDRLLEPFASGQERLLGVVHFAMPSGPTISCATAAGVNQACQSSCQAALHLVQALVRAELPHPPQLWLVTRGAIFHAGLQAIGGEAKRGDDSGRDLAASTVWGLGQVIGREHSEFQCVLVDLDPAADLANLHDLCDELQATDRPMEGQVLFRNGGRYVARLTRSLASIKPRATVIRPDRTYLITGGLGAIGLKVARWLVARGARHLLLLGRKSPNGAAQSAVEQLRRDGIEVTIRGVDVSKYQQLAGVFDEIQQRLAPLAGVFHLAGVLADRLLIDHSWNLFAEVFAPKVDGAWNLHHLTRHRDLDLFVLFSSAATLLGSAGLANYVAANRFLDGLAALRRGQGLPGMSINWGPWADLGMARSMTGERMAEWSALGMQSMSPSRALDALAVVLDLDTSQVAVMSMDWSCLGAHPAVHSYGRLLESLLETTHRQPSLRQQIASAPASQRRAMLGFHVAALVGRVLGARPGETVSMKRGFFDLGMDSLRATELRNLLQTNFECALAATLTFKFPNVEALADHLGETLFGIRAARQLDQERGRSSAAAATATVQSALAAEEAVVRGLVDDELAQLEELLKADL